MRKKSINENNLHKILLSSIDVVLKEGRWSKEGIGQYSILGKEYFDGFEYDPTDYVDDGDL